MSALREMQLDFARTLFGEGHSGFDGQIRSQGLSGQRRLHIYRNNIMASLTEALRAVYPVVQRLVGEGFFRYSTAQYIRRHPSRSGNLHDFGAQFPDFLKGFEPAITLAYLPDVASLEWAYHQVFHAADHPPLDLAALGRIPEGHSAELTFKLHPAARLLASRYPILRIWQINQSDTGADQTVNLAEGGIRLLVIRRGLDIAMQPLGEGEFALLQALTEGHDLTTACEQALKVQADFDVAVGLRRHILGGTLVDFALCTPVTR